MDKFVIHDIAFQNLEFQDQLKKIKKHILENPYLLLGINIDPNLNKKYHEFLKSKSFHKELELFLEYPSTKYHCK